MLSVATQRYKVVVRFVDHTVRGFVTSDQLGTVEEMVGSGPRSGMDRIRLTPAEGGGIRELSIANAKALFFVTTFDGDMAHQALHFHQNAPILPGLWVRVEFQDGEQIEGFISNSPDFVLREGFFILPTDPDGNNRLIYVLKSQLKGFSVLGIRNSLRLPTL